MYFLKYLVPRIESNGILFSLNYITAKTNLTDGANLNNLMIILFLVNSLLTVKYH